MRFGPFSEGEIRVVVREIVRALTFLHCRELVHRDIKRESLVLLIFFFFFFFVPFVFLTFFFFTTLMIAWFLLFLLFSSLHSDSKKILQ